VRQHSGCAVSMCVAAHSEVNVKGKPADCAVVLTLSLLMSDIYGAPCKARTFYAVYIYIYIYIYIIWNYVWQH
jgi:hypothetical protein